MDQEHVCRLVSKQLKLLSLEEDSEMLEQQFYIGKLSRQQLKERGVALYSLCTGEQRTGLAGRAIVEFTNSNLQILPTHVIKVGDVVQIDYPSNERETESWSGTVCKVTPGSVSVAFKDTFPPEATHGLRMVKLANQVAFESALQRLESYAKTQHFPALGIIFGQSQPSRLFAHPFTISDNCWHNKGLNLSQRGAVVEALTVAELALIHGPPGTGKTATIVEIILQLVDPRIFATESKPMHILVCGPSNLSVDNIVERLISQKTAISLVRLGHPARILPSVQAHSLDSQLADGDAAALVKDIRSEISTCLKRLGTKKTNSREIYTELRALRTELRVRERRAIEDLIRGSSVVLSTLSMAGSYALKSRPFDVVIIDEAGQALEAESWIALLLAKKFILAGDHCQLPPTVTSPEAEKGGLGVTLFERLVRKQPPIAGAISLLTRQYRMSSTIMRWASEEFYGGQLNADPTVANHLLCGLLGVKSDENTRAAMVFIDTAGFGFWESQSTEDQSKSNEEEAKIVIKHLEQLVEAGVPAREIAIITPYNAQVGLLESLQGAGCAGVEIGSVDGFQGREKEAIIISLVRSNEQGEIGFLSEVRRTNVAITRARRHVCLVGNSNTLDRHPFYKRLVLHSASNPLSSPPVL